VLTGSILRDDGALRVCVQLVEAPRGALVWTHIAHAPVARVFQLQDSLVRGIVESLALPLSLRESEALEHDVPASENGFTDYLRANRLSHDVTRLPEARDLYLRAVREDARYAPAWARLARIYRFMAKFGIDDETDYLTRAEQAAGRALALNPELSSAHFVQAQLELESGRSAAALARLFDRASHRRSDPQLFAALVQACRYGGLLDASKAADRHARTLDPTSRTSVAYTYWMGGDLTRAVEEGRRVDDMGVGLLLVAAGRLDEARVWLADAERRYAEFAVSRAYVRALSAFVNGDRVASVEAADAVSRRPTFRDPEGLYSIAVVMMWNNEPARALEVLSQAIDRGFACAAALDSDPIWRPLHAQFEFMAGREAVVRRHREFAAAFVTADGDGLLSRGGSRSTTPPARAAAHEISPTQF
jgi:tetratricopeptide (TPR) repeat protein